MKQWLALVARLVVGGVWLYAGLVKLPDPAASIESVRAYELLPGAWVEPVGYLLPPLEVVLGLALVLGVMTRGAAVLSALLLGAFVFGISWAWSQGLEIDCGCFGDGGPNPDAAAEYPWEIARDVGLIAMSVFVVAVGSSRLALDGVLFRHRALEPTDIDGSEHLPELTPDQDDQQEIER
ncbi:DoxX family protein [Nocardioides sp. R-C-SC26]|uniref:DoxX family protein n=1 Tax=Nocardioides sp. R-C-SC26 TaxID=2870414 RepID=UPI001E5CB57A|nr:DoxX family protein [Nocardioides sp. R-C-SC26]